MTLFFCSSLDTVFAQGGSCSCFAMSLKEEPKERRVPPSAQGPSAKTVMITKVQIQDSCYPEEHYFPTLLSMKDLKGCVGFTLTRVNWIDSVDGHPHTYQLSKVSTDLIEQLRESSEGNSYSYLFARKFSSDLLETLISFL